MTIVRALLREWIGGCARVRGYGGLRGHARRRPVRSGMLHRNLTVHAGAANLCRL